MKVAIERLAITDRQPHRAARHATPPNHRLSLRQALTADPRLFRQFSGAPIYQRWRPRHVLLRNVLSHRIDPQLKADLEALARSDDRSLAKYVQHILQQHVDAERTKKGKK